MPRGIDIYDEAKLQGRLWTPDTAPLSNIAIWLDPRDSNSVTFSGGAISQIANKGGLGFGHATQGTSGNRPTFSPTVFGGGRGGVVHAAGSAQYFDLPSLSGVSWTAAELLYVFRRNAVPPATEALSGPLFSCATAPGDGGEHEPYTDGNLYVATFTTARKSAGTPIAALSSTRIVNVRSAASHWSYWIDGKSQFTTATNTFAKPSSPAIGHIHYLTFDYYLDGAWAEVLCFPALLSSAARSRFLGYLAWKHGLVANLPATEPFKTRPPLIGS